MEDGISKSKTVTTVSFINDSFFFCSYSFFQFTKEFPQSAFSVDSGSKNNIVHKIDCSNCEAVYFSQFKQSLISRLGEHKRSVSHCAYETNQIAKHCR